MRPLAEQLEDRRLVAVASFWFVGVPERVQVGDAFEAEIWASENDPGRHGLRGVAVDVQWNPDVLEATDVEITERLPLLNGGDVQQGLIQNLCGYSRLSSLGSEGGAIGNLWPERFATIEFLAIGQGETEIGMTQGGSRIVPVPVASLRSEHLSFEPSSIVVEQPAPQSVQSDVFFGAPARLDVGDRALVPLWTIADYPPSSTVVVSVSEHLQVVSASDGDEPLAAETSVVDSNTARFANLGTPEPATGAVLNLIGNTTVDAVMSGEAVMQAIAEDGTILTTHIRIGQMEQLEERTHPSSLMGIIVAAPEEMILGDIAKVSVYLADLREEDELAGVFAAGVDVLLGGDDGGPLSIVDGSVGHGDFWLAPEAEIIDELSIHFAGVDPDGQPDAHAAKLLGVFEVEATAVGTAVIATMPDSSSLTENLLLGHDGPLNESLGEDGEIDFGGAVIEVREPFTASNGTDVNRDGATTVLDALAWVNHVQETGLYEVAPGGDWDGQPAPDVDGNGMVTPMDLLTVVHTLEA